MKLYPASQLILKFLAIDENGRFKLKKNDVTPGYP